jgi:hypothetical protein
MALSVRIDEIDKILYNIQYMASIPGELWQSAKNVGGAVKEGAKNGKTLPGKLTDAVTKGGVRLAVEPARLGLELALKPGLRLTGNAVKSATSFAMGHTKNMLLNLPWIPFRKTSQKASDAVASAHNETPPLPPRLPRTDRFGRFPG